jgi:hypothetical protein
MACRYDRAFSENALKALLPGGPFRFMVTDLPRHNKDPYCMDLQLREKNTLMYYRGTTRLLTVQIKLNGGLHAVATADKAYGAYPLCRDEYAKLMKRPWMAAESTEMKRAFDVYLASAAKACRANYYREGTEGYLQNQLCCEWTKPGSEWLVIDRECVIGFDTRGEQREYYDPILNPYASIRNEFQTQDKVTWGVPAGKSFGDELDLLALDREGKVVLIELKHGGNASGIYWGPMQILAYRDVFRKKLSEISPSLKELVRQKVALGLLSEDALARLPQGDFAFGGAVLGIGDPNPRSSCWGKMDLVVKRLGVSMSAEDKGALRLISFS